MKKQYLMLVFCAVCINAFMQQDPEAKKILDQVAEKTGSYRTIQVNYTLTVEDRKEKTTSSSEGQIWIKGGKYRLDAPESVVYFDGKTMWTYNEDINEVTITEPDMEDEDFLSNPAKILTWYNRDFKYRYVQKTVLNGHEMHEIDLFPNNLQQPYSRIRIYIDAGNLLLYLIKSIGKDGIDYSILLSDYVTGKEMNDALFVFDPAKFKKIEIVDMRF
ncbi:MAG: outer membrane lipoprotein carrier protein LolA [Bacteroidales bacterium]|nr:outer membrane lipoprotein carrier protein LolA [Bacteroidales bacterium]